MGLCSAKGEMRNVSWVTRLSKVLQDIVIVLAMIFLAAVFILSLAFTTRVLDYKMGYDYLSIGPNSTLCGIISGAVLVFLLVWAGKKWEHRIEVLDIRRYIAAVTCISLLLCVLWVMLADVVPFTDDKDICLVGQAMVTGDSYRLDEAPYYQAFPYQAAMELLAALAYRLFGIHFCRALQLLQCVLSALTVTFICLMSDELFHSNKATVLTGIILMLFSPLVFYTTFIYGNTCALPFLFCGLWLQIRWFMGGPVADALLAGLSASVAVLLKSSYIAVLIAMVITWVLGSLSSRSLRGIGFACATIAMCLCLSTGAKALSSAITGRAYVESRAMPSLCALAMGLHDDPEVGLGPGWYDAWGWKPHDVTPRQDIINSLRGFAQDPGKAASFFTRKLASEWAEPTYVSLLHSNCDLTSNDWPYPGYKNYGRDVPFVIDRIYYGPTNELLIDVLDGLQSLIYGFALYLLIRRRFDLSIEYLTPLLMCTGGFILFTFWEAKSQYVMVYVLALVPYAAAGLDAAFLGTHVISESAMEQYSAHGASTRSGTFG